MELVKSFEEKLQEQRLKYTKIGNRHNLQEGKIPPQAPDLEEAVLGALMLDKDAISMVLDMLSPETFYVERNKEIYKAIIKLFNDSKPIDILSVSNELKSAGKLEFVGGAYFVSDLTNRVGSAANIEYHSRIISEKFIMRELIKISGELQKQAYDDTTDIFELLDFAEKSLFDITQGNLKTSYEDMGSLISRAIKDIEELSSAKEGLSGVASGFIDLDRVTSGWQKSDLVIVAARPGMGKTSFALTIARNAAVDFKKPVAIFSLEMGASQIVRRMISGEAEIEASKLRNGNLEDHEWTQLSVKIDKLSEAPILIDETASLNVFELRAKCRRLKAHFDIELIVIDYLQLMNAQSGKKGVGNRVEEISIISRSLKAIAKELDVPVIALSQLSRDVEKRQGSKKPILSDLRESGSIEQDADQVLFIYRPDYYGFSEDSEGDAIDEGMSEIIIAKNRHGAVQSVPIKFVPKYAKFVDSNEYSIPSMGSTINVGSKLNVGSDDETPF